MTFTAIASDDGLPLADITPVLQIILSFCQMIIGFIDYIYGAENVILANNQTKQTMQTS